MGCAAAGNQRRTTGRAPLRVTPQVSAEPSESTPSNSEGVTWSTNCSTREESTAVVRAGRSEPETSDPATTLPARKTHDQPDHQPESAAEEAVDDPQVQAIGPAPHRVTDPSADAAAHDEQRDERADHRHEAPRRIDGVGDEGHGPYGRARPGGETCQRSQGCGETRPQAGGRGAQQDQRDHHVDDPGHDPPPSSMLASCSAGILPRRAWTAGGRSAGALAAVRRVVADAPGLRAELPGGICHEPAERAAEVRQVVEAAAPGDGGDRLVGRLEQAEGVADAQTRDVFARGESDRPS